MSDFAPSHAFPHHDPYGDLIPRRKGSRIHVVLSATSLAIALALAIAGVLGAFDVSDVRASTLIAATLGLLLLPLIFVDPLHGVLVYAIIAPISPELSGNLRLQDPLVPIILLGVFIQNFRRPTRKAKLRLFWPLAAYGGFAVGFTLLAMVTMPNGRSPNIFHALKVVQYLVIALAVGTSVRSRRDLTMLMGAVMVGLLLLALQLNYDTDAAIKRVTGATVNEKANVLSVYLAVASAVTLGVADRVKDRLASAGLFLFLALCAYAMVLTRSRTGMAAIGVSIIFGFFFMKRKVIPLFAVLGAAGLAVLRPSFFERFSTLGAVVGFGQDSSFDARVNALEFIWRRVTKTVYSIVFGEGRGVEELGFADSQWGIELLYGGIVGLLIFTILVFACLYIAQLNWRQTRMRMDAVGAAGMSGMLGMIAAFVGAFGLTAWSSIRLAEVVFLLIGMVIATRRLLDEEASRRDDVEYALRKSPKAPEIAPAPSLPEY